MLAAIIRARAARAKAGSRGGVRGIAERRRTFCTRWLGSKNVQLLLLLLLLLLLPLLPLPLPLLLLPLPLLLLPPLLPLPHPRAASSASSPNRCEKRYRRKRSKSCFKSVQLMKTQLYSA
jgi:hypothetical protein